MQQRVAFVSHSGKHAVQCTRQRWYSYSQHVPIIICRIVQFLAILAVAKSETPIRRATGSVCVNTKSAFKHTAVTYKRALICSHPLNNKSQRPNAAHRIIKPKLFDSSMSTQHLLLRASTRPSDCNVETQSRPNHAAALGRCQVLCLMRN